MGAEKAGPLFQRFLFAAMMIVKHCERREIKERKNRMNVRAIKT